MDNGQKKMVGLQKNKGEKKCNKRDLTDDEYDIFRVQQKQKIKQHMLNQLVAITVFTSEMDKKHSITSTYTSETTAS